MQGVEGESPRDGCEQNGPSFRDSAMLSRNEQAVCYHREMEIEGRETGTPSCRTAGDRKFSKLER